MPGVPNLPGVPSFDSDDLKSAMDLLAELAGTYPEDAPEAVILTAARNLAATRTIALLEARTQEQR